MISKEMKHFIHVSESRVIPFPEWEKVSHMLGFLPSSFAAPSTYQTTPITNS